MNRAMNPNSIANLKKGRTDINRRSRYSYTKLAQITQRMTYGKFTIAMIAKFAGVSWASAQRWVTAMHSAGVVHIVEYLRSPNNKVTSRVYQWGSGTDAPRPAKVPRREYLRQYRQRKQTLEGAWKPAQQSNGLSEDGRA